MILLLKSILLQINYNHKTWILNNLNNLCLRDPETPITNTNLHIKIIAQNVIEQITPSQLVSKNIEIMKIKEKHMLDLTLHRNHLYNTSALLPVKITRTEQRTNLQTPLIDTE